MAIIGIMLMASQPLGQPKNKNKLVDRGKTIPLSAKILYRKKIMEEQKRQRKDSKFKNTLCVANFNVRLVKKDELGGFYMPDKILESSDSVIFF